MQAERMGVKTHTKFFIKIIMFLLTKASRRGEIYRRFHRHCQYARIVQHVDGAALW